MQSGCDRQNDGHKSDPVRILFFHTDVPNTEIKIILNMRLRYFGKHRLPVSN